MRLKAIFCSLVLLFLMSFDCSFVPQYVDAAHKMCSTFTDSEFWFSNTLVSLPFLFIFVLHVLFELDSAL